MKLESPHGWYVRQHEKGWYRWFAWYPVIIENDDEKYRGKYRWLEWVEKRVTGMNDSDRISTATYEYRKIKS